MFFWDETRQKWSFFLFALNGSAGSGVGGGVQVRRRRRRRRRCGRRRDAGAGGGGADVARRRLRRRPLFLLGVCRRGPRARRLRPVAAVAAQGRSIASFLLTTVNLNVVHTLNIMKKVIAFFFFNGATWSSSNRDLSSSMISIRIE